jgi:hypothetical protein
VLPVESPQPTPIAAAAAPAPVLPVESPQPTPFVPLTPLQPIILPLFTTPIAQAAPAPIGNSVIINGSGSNSVFMSSHKPTSMVNVRSVDLTSPETETPLQMSAATRLGIAVGMLHMVNEKAEKVSGITARIPKQQLHAEFKMKKTLAIANSIGDDIHHVPILSNGSEGAGAGVNGGRGWHAMAFFYQSETVRVGRSPVFYMSQELHEISMEELKQSGRDPWQFLRYDHHCAVVMEKYVIPVDDAYEAQDPFDQLLAMSSPRVFVSMTLLRSCAKELDGKYVLALLLSTYCDDQRIDAMVYSLQDCQIHIWHGTDLLNHFWSDVNASYGDHAVVLAALRLF